MSRRRADQPMPTCGSSRGQGRAGRGTRRRRWSASCAKSWAATSRSTASTRSSSTPIRTSISTCSSTRAAWWRARRAPSRWRRLPGSRPPVCPRSILLPADFPLAASSRLAQAESLLTRRRPRLGERSAAARAPECGYLREHVAHRACGAERLARRLDGRFVLGRLGASTTTAGVSRSRRLRGGPGDPGGCRSASRSTARAASVTSRLHAPHRAGSAQAPRCVCSWLSGGQ